MFLYNNLFEKKTVIQDVFQIYFNIKTSINNSINQTIHYFDFYIFLMYFNDKLASYLRMIAVWTPHIVGTQKQWMCVNLKIWRPTHEIKRLKQAYA